MNIRLVTEAEAGEALTVQLAAFVTEGLRYNRIDIPPLQDTYDDVLREVQAGRVFAAFDGERMVGSIRLTLEGDIGWISRVAVAPDQHGRGIGTQLVGHAERAAPDAVSRFQLLAAAGSDGNIRLYERLGYRIVEHTTDAAGAPMVLMRKAR